MTYATDDAVAPQPVAQKSLWEDCIDVFVAPTELFERRRNGPFAAPFIVLLVLATVFYYVLLPAQGILIRSSMTPEMLAKAGKAMKIFSIVGGIGVPIITAVLVTLTALLLWGLARLVDAKPTFSQMMTVAIFAGFIGILAQITSGVVIMLHGEQGFEPMKHATLGLTRFVDAKSMSKPLLAVLARFEPFAIWQAVIWAIGFRVMTGVSKQKAAMVAFGTWILFAIPGVLGGSLAGNKLGHVEITTGD